MYSITNPCDLDPNLDAISESLSESSHNLGGCSLAWNAFLVKVSRKSVLYFLKELRGMTSILFFKFCNEVVYPKGHVFIFFRLFRIKKYFSSPFIWIQIKAKQTPCIPIKGRLNWATCWCHRPSVGQIISAAGVPLPPPPCSDFKTPISDDCFDPTV